MNVYAYEKIAYHIKDNCPSSYNTFIVKHNRRNIFSYNNKILRTYLYEHIYYIKNIASYIFFFFLSLIFKIFFDRLKGILI